MKLAPALSPDPEEQVPASGGRQITETRGARLVRAATASSSFISLIVLFAVLSIASSAFLSVGNMKELLEANASIGIVACAGTLVIVAGGVDLSVGAIYAVAGVISAKVASSAGVDAGLAAGVAAGLGLGLMNGLVVTAGGVNPFIATLAGATIFGGLAQVLAGGNLITPSATGFTTLGRGSFLGVEYSVWIFAAAAAILGLLLARGRLGRQIKAVGANPSAARLSGISNGTTTMATYVISGLSAGIAGVVDVSQAGQAQASIGGFSFVLSVIAAIAVGGTYLGGGRGSMLKTVIGVLFLGGVGNGLTLIGVNPVYEQFVIGLLIVAALGLERATAHRRTG